MLDGRTASGHRTQDRAPFILCLDRDGAGGRTRVCELELSLFARVRGRSRKCGVATRSAIEQIASILKMMRHANMPIQRQLIMPVAKSCLLQRHSTYLILKYWLPVAVCAGCIFYLSVSCNISVVGMAFYVSESDKIDHMMAYAGLSGCCYRAFQSVPRPWMAKYCGSLAVLAATVFGLFCEWCQLSVPGRMADGMDALANSVGAVFGFAVLSMRVSFRTGVGNSRIRHLMQNW
jgi:hypothetical protein